MQLDTILGIDTAEVTRPRLAPGTVPVWVLFDRLVRGLSIAEIARRWRVSQPTVYRHLKTAREAQDDPTVALLLRVYEGRPS
jgi:predicted RNA polymerase sigma factor